MTIRVQPQTKKASAENVESVGIEESDLSLTENTDYKYFFLYDEWAKEIDTFVDIFDGVPYHAAVARARLLGDDEASKKIERVLTNLSLRSRYNNHLYGPCLVTTPEEISYILFGKLLRRHEEMGTIKDFLKRAKF